MEKKKKFSSTFLGSLGGSENQTDKDRLSRVELNLNLDYQSSFDSPISHLYVPYKEGFKSQDHVHLHIDTDGIDFIGDDHKSIYDLGKKEKEISEYHISEM